MRVFLTLKLSVLAIGYTEKIPPDQIKSECLAVNCNKMPVNFASAVKDFHKLNFRRLLSRESVKAGEIGWGYNWRFSGNVKISRTPPFPLSLVEKFLSLWTVPFFWSFPSHSIQAGLFYR